MKSNQSFIIFFVFLFAFLNQINASEILSDKKVFFIPITEFSKNIQPTQFQFGKPSVDNRIKKFKKKKSLKDLNQYLAKKPIPFIEGPFSKKWIIDRHHFSLALIKSKSFFLTKKFELKNIMVAFQKVQLKTSRPIYKMTMAEFESELLKRKMIYPYKNGKLMPIEHLPAKIEDLTVDYSRGLSWLVRKSGAYQKTSIPFAEFYWAKYLKSNLDIEQQVYTRNTLKKAIRLALIENEETRELPGFNGQGLNESTREIKIEKALIKLINSKLIQ